MKRKVTELEQQLIQNGWYLTNKRYVGKHSEKILCYEYHKTSDLRNDNKTYDLFIQLDQKRSQIVKYGVANLFVERMGSDELMVIRFLFLELRHFVERLTKAREPRPINPILNEPTSVDWAETNELVAEKSKPLPLTPEQLDELCQEKEQGGE